jgi:hypothetical protein
MSSPQDIYKSLFAGQRISVRLADKKAFESLRVALCREHQTPKLLLELTTDSLCASYNAEEAIGTFWLGIPRKSAKQHSYEIISIESNDAQVQTNS